MAADAVTRFDTPEHRRLEDARTGRAPWKAWGPYLSERQWGTVREDYSDDGDAWSYFTHDQARSRAYRWGEDGIAGVCDDRQRLCLALALWNGADPILKERLFGLTNGEGNHGEDVKEYYFYLDSTPTHSYMKCLYKYPQRAFPYERPRRDERPPRASTSSSTSCSTPGVFDEDRYFDVDVEYAKAAPDDVLIRVTAHNRGPDAATLHVLPTLWFRNTWSWGDASPGPSLTRGRRRRGVARARTPSSATGTLRARRASRRCCSARTRRTTSGCSARRTRRRTSRTASTTPSSTARRTRSTRRARGTKVAAHYALRDRGRGERDGPRAPHGRDAPPAGDAPFGAASTRVLAARRDEADALLRDRHPGRRSTPTRALVMRQALAGLLWGKQYYEYDVHRWLREHGVNPWDAGATARPVRNAPWFHMVNGDIISMPDKWEYPWFAAWDLAFHTRAAGARRRRLRQGAGRAAAPHALPAPQRPDPGLRVELQRRQPAGARRGRRCASTSARPRSAGEGDPSSSRGSSSGC